MSRSIKSKLQAECAALGLSTAGTVTQLESRLTATAEAVEDTAAAVTIDANDLHPAAGSTGKPSIHPFNAALFGGAIGAVWHLLG